MKRMSRDDIGHWHGGRSRCIEVNLRTGKPPSPEACLYGFSTCLIYSWRSAFRRAFLCSNSLSCSGEMSYRFDGSAMFLAASSGHSRESEPLPTVLPTIKLHLDYAHYTRLDSKKLKRKKETSRLSYQNHQITIINWIINQLSETFLFFPQCFQESSDSVEARFVTNELNINSWNYWKMLRKTK